MPHFSVLPLIAAIAIIVFSAIYNIYGDNSENLLPYGHKVE